MVVKGSFNKKPSATACNNKKPKWPTVMLS